MQTYAEMIISAIKGYEAEHGVYPTFVLMTSDVAQALFKDVEHAPNKYKSLIKVDQTGREAMKVMVGPDGVEIGQIIGFNRVELASDVGTIVKKRLVQ